jgi:hypothetical protein
MNPRDLPNPRVRSAGRAVPRGSTVAANLGVARAQEAPAPPGLSGLPSRFRLRFWRDAAVTPRACTQRPLPSGFSPFCNSYICRNVVRTTFKAASMPEGARQSGSGDARPAPGTLRPSAPAPRPGRCGPPISLGLTARREHTGDAREHLVASTQHRHLRLLSHSDTVLLLQ